MRSLRPISRRNAIVSALSLFPAAKLISAQPFQFAPAPQAGQPAQQPAPSGQPGPTFSSSVKVVNVFATVHDQKGKIINDLMKDDFVLEEDERPQTIRYFSRQTDLPLTVGVLIDTSMSERLMIDPEKEASRTFFQDVLRPDRDKAFLIHFDREVELLEDLTASREKLEKALDQLDRPTWSRSSDDHTGDTSTTQDNPDNGSQNGGYGGRGGRGRGQGYGHGGTQLYDAIYLASDDILKKVSGRKAVILLTDGVDNGSKVSLTEAISTAQRADTLAYSIRIAQEESSNPFGGFGGPGMGRHGGMGGGGMGRGGGGRGPYSARPDGKKILEQISRETGGGYFEYSKKKSVGDIYAQIEEELRNQYSIGYTSDRPDTEGGFRKIKLTVKKIKNLIVQARDGYYATPQRA